jgi:hypothetical protein
MQTVNYTIVQTDAGWVLKLYSATNIVTVGTPFKLYIDALRAVQTLQIHLTKRDKMLAT